MAGVVCGTPTPPILGECVGQRRGGYYSGCGHELPYTLSPEPAHERAHVDSEGKRLPVLVRAWNRHKLARMFF